MYLVAGGYVPGGLTDLTETLEEGGSAWTTHEPLWTGITDARILTLNNIPYMFGGNVGPANYGWSVSPSADILAWDDDTKKWSTTGSMKEARDNHGVSAIVIDWDTLNACKP